MLLSLEEKRLICDAIILPLWSLSFKYTKIWTTILIAYDERKIEIFSRMPLFNKDTTIPFQAIKSVKKDISVSRNITHLVKIEYITDDGETKEVEVYSVQLFNWFTEQNQQRRYEIFSRALIK